MSEPQKSAGSSHQGTEQLRGIRIMRGTAARHPKGCSNRGLRHTSICREAAWSNHIEPRVPGGEPFKKLTRPTRLQTHVFELLGVKLKM